MADIEVLRGAVGRVGGPAWLEPGRRRAFEAFAARGFPTLADEDWRYTDLSGAAALIQERAAAAIPCPPDLEPELRAKLPSLATCTTVVLVCGQFRPDLSSLPSLAGLRISVLGEGSAAEYGSVDALTQRLAAPNGALAANPLALLNTALLRNVLWIEIAPGTTIIEPISVVLAGTGESASHARILVDVGANATATIIEQHVSSGTAVSNTVTDVRCGRGSALTFLKLQDEGDAATHIASQSFAAADDSRLALLHLDLGARLARNDLVIRLEGTGACVNADGLFFADGARHLDNHTRIDHVARHTTSRERYRGIADGQGRGVFNGKVIVHPGAAGTDARMASENLLLSGTAEIDTKPELEIYADDVKCSHGATTGQLDASAIFYLRSRGIPYEQARRLLIASFAREVVRSFGIPALDAHLTELVARRLPEIGEVSETA